MLPILLLTCGLIWAVVLAHQIQRRGFVVLALWLAVAPLVAAAVWQILFAAEPPPPETALTAEAPTQPAIPETKLMARDFLDPTRLVFALFLALMVGDTLIRRQLPRLDRAERLMLLFTALLVISALTLSRRPLFALQTACDAFAIPFISYAVARRVVTTEDRFRQFALAVAVAAACALLAALVERAVQPELLYRVRGPFPTANTMYVMAAVGWFVALAEGRHRWWGIPAPVRAFVRYAAPLVVGLTLGRANWLGLVCGVAVCLWLARPLLPFPSKALGIGLMSLGLAAAVLMLPMLLPETLVEQRIWNARTATSRLGAWLVIAREGFDQPLVGLGLHNLRYLLADIDPRRWPGGFVTTAHNSWLALTAELGVLGVACYAAIIATVARAGWRLSRRAGVPQDRWRGVALVGLLVAYLVPSLFANTLYIDTSLHHVYVYAYAGAVAALASRPRAVVRPQVRAPAVPAGSP